MVVDFTAGMVRASKQKCNTIRTSYYGKTMQVLVCSAAKVLVLCREALHARTAGTSSGFGSDQVSINMPDAFDMDSEVEGLRGQVGRLKQVP